MTRLPDWQTRIEGFLRIHRDDCFSYGDWDCCLFVCSAIQAMTGEDPAEAFRGEYRSRAEAFAAVKRYCGSTSLRVLVNRVTMERGMKNIMPNFVGRGDVVLVRRGKRGVSLGIVSLSGRSVQVVTPTGLQECPLSLVVDGWRV